MYIIGLSKDVCNYILSDAEQTKRIGVILQFNANHSFH